MEPLNRDNVISKKDLESGKYIYYIDRWVRSDDVFPTKEEREHKWYFEIPVIWRILDKKRIIEENERQRRLKNGLIVVDEQ